MRVLMLLFNPMGKGTYWRAFHLARGLAQRGHHIALLATSPNRHLHFASHPDEQPGVTLVETPDLLWGPLRSGWDVWNALTRIHWSRGQQFDLVHAFEARPVVILPALYWQRRRKVPLVMDWCDWFGRGGSVEERPNPLVRAVLRPVETFFEERFRTWANGTTVINRLLAQRAADLGVEPHTILHLPNGSDVAHICPLPRGAARRALGWPEDELLIGYLGAIFLRDARLMAQAFDRIHQAEPRARLLLIGYCNVPVETMVAHPAAVRRTGRIPYAELNRYLAACDLCWLPLRDRSANRGRFPLKLNDYMAAGQPVVVTAIGEITELVRAGDFGQVAADNPQDLARQTLSLLRDPARRQAMGERARQLAETRFSWEQITQKLELFYRHVLATWQSS